MQTRRVQGASAASASSASAPVRFRARATATSNEKRAWRGEHAGPAPTGANPGRGRGLDGTKYAQSSLPSDYRPGLGLGWRRRWLLAGLHGSCQLRGAASSVLARHAGSKPRPREVTSASKTFIFGKLRLCGRGYRTSSCLDFYIGLLTTLPPGSLLLSLHTATRLPFLKTHGKFPPCPCRKLSNSSAMPTRRS